MGQRQVREAGEQPMTDDQYTEVIGALRANDKEHESYNRRLHEHDEALRELQQTQIQIERLTNAVNNLTAGVLDMKTAIQGVDNRVAAIEREPGDNWKKATWKIIELLIAAAVGYFIAIAAKGV